MMVLVLTLTLVVASLAGGLAVVAHTERQIAAAHERTVELGYAAEAAVLRGVATLRGLADWTLVPGGPFETALSSGPRVFWVPPDRLDLDARTTTMNASLARQFPLGANTPRWRLVGWGRDPDAVTPIMVAIWVADDVNDADADARRDRNGRLVVRGEALSTAASGLVVDAHVVRDDAGVRVVSWRMVY